MQGHGTACHDMVVWLLQTFVDDSFKNILLTESALDLLRQFEAILQRDSLKVGPMCSIII